MQGSGQDGHLCELKLFFSLSVAIISDVISAIMMMVTCCWVLGEEYPRRMRKRKEGRSRKMSHTLVSSQ